MEYGLIGGKLGHSYSKTIHELLCGYSYELCPLPTEADARAFLQRRQFKAINVTIPYKKLVMEYCSFIDPRARAIDAVNTVVNKNGLLYGYNTDYLGFAHLCEAHGVELAGKTVLILGTGGTHNTTRAVALDKGAAKVLTVSRTPDPEKGELSYAEAVRSGAQVVFNTTPAGMYPNVGVCSLDVAAMPGLEAVVDVVYNPNKTELILRAEDAGVPVAVGGLEMLVAQAVYAAEYFLGRKFEDAPGRVDGIVLNPGGYAHYSVAILDALRLCSVPAVEVMLDAPDEREPFRKTDVVSFGCQGHFIGEGPQGYLHACIWLAQLLRTDGSSKAHIVM